MLPLRATDDGAPGDAPRAERKPDDAGAASAKMDLYTPGVLVLDPPGDHFDDAAAAMSCTDVSETVFSRLLRLPFSSTDILRIRTMEDGLRLLGDALLGPGLGPAKALVGLAGLRSVAKVRFRPVE